MNDPPHIVGADVVAPHQMLDDRIVQHLFECWFGIHGVHDLFSCRFGLAARVFTRNPPKHPRGRSRKQFGAPVPWCLGFHEII
ncbi:hypothetical protein CIT26_29990 [Mesorhizobium temperatum]|uniref:Uncharacterized protein n=1 Tax=Mesorhizobium temperatum TaxID=241416 RepID=A0A271LEA1_9HYPH|nr:hypothetical protein CIT26_29990 [Mesorhizobium temperatum]